MALGNVLSIAGCIVLADELSHVLSKDKDLSRAFIVDNEEGRYLQGKLIKNDIETEIIEPSEMRRASNQDRFSVLIWMRGAAHCREAGNLRDNLTFALSNMAECSGLCLCFYGRCHGALDHLEEVEEEVRVPVMALTDVAGQEVSGCMAANIGGEKEYLRTVASNPDTFLVTPEWADEWYRNHVHLGKKGMRQCANAFMLQNGYTEIMRLDNGLGEGDGGEDRLRDFSQGQGVRVINRLVGLSVFENTYSLAKKMLAELRPCTLSPFIMKSVPMLYRASGIMVHRMGPTV